jgi:predicted dehydrogenase
VTLLRIGLVGYGFGGRCFHAPFLAAAAECEFLGVVTNSPERRKAFTEQFRDRTTFDSLEQLRAAGAEAVTISTPVETVLLSEQLQVPLTVYQNRRWDSDFLTVRKALADGVLGDAVRFESRFERFAPDPGPPASGGGTLLDFGSHLVDQALVLCGPAEWVYAEMHTGPDPTAVDDDAFIAITHANGMQSQLWGSWRENAPGPRFRVTGTAASYVTVHDMDGQEHLLVAGHSPATDPDWGAEPEQRWGRVFRDGKSEVLRSERGAWDTFYPAFAATVRGIGPVPVSPWDAVATAQVLDAARESAVKRTLVRLGPAAFS